jgi:hypothetical protein
VAATSAKTARATKQKHARVCGVVEATDERRDRQHQAHAAGDQPPPAPPQAAERRRAPQHRQARRENESRQEDGADGVPLVPWTLFLIGWLMILVVVGHSSHDWRNRNNTLSAFHRANKPAHVRASDAKHQNEHRHVFAKLHSWRALHLLLKRCSKKPRRPRAGNIFNKFVNR